MKNKEYISPVQFYFIVAGFILGTAIILSTGIDIAGKDIWISHLIAMSASIIILLMMFFIVQKNPDKEISEIFDKLFGRIISKLLLIIYFIFSLLLAGLVIDNVGEFMYLMVLQNTHEWIFILTITIICGYILSKGIEVVSRCVEIIILFSLSSFIFIFLLLMMNANVGDLLPIFSKNASDIFKSSIIIGSYPYCEIVILFFVIPNIKTEDRPRALKSGILGIVTATCILMILDILIIVILGEKEAARMLFATYEITKMIRVGDFVERIELIILGIWFFTAYTKISFIFYALTKSIQGIFSVKDYKRLAMPMAFFLIPISDSAFINYEVAIRAIVIHWPVIIMIIILMIISTFFAIILKR